MKITKKQKRNGIIVLVTIGIIASLFYLNSIQINSVSPTPYSVGSNGQSSIKPFALVSCIPDEGFDNCDGQDNSYGDAHAYAEIQLAVPYQDMQLLKWCTQYQITGDKAYVYMNIGNWNSILETANCDRDGCDGQALSDSGVFCWTTECPAFLVFDEDTASNGDWTWIISGRGWEGTGNCFVKPVCQSNWVCQPWNTCVDGQQARTCTDQNNCQVKKIETQSCSVACTPNWQTGAWGACVSNTQTRTVTDLNNCGVNIGKPSVSQSCSSTCTPNWQTGDWGVCISGTQTRTVTDSNNCGINTNKPITSQSCSGMCTPNWQMSEWSECTNKIQTRTVTDINSCGIIASKPPETQSCGDNTIYYIIGGVAGIVILLGIVWYKFR